MTGLVIFFLKIAFQTFPSGCKRASEASLWVWIVQVIREENMVGKSEVTDETKSSSAVAADLALVTGWHSPLLQSCVEC